MSSKIFPSLCRPWPPEPAKLHLVMVLPDGFVRVHDPMKRHFTAEHRLSDAEINLIRAAASEDVPLKGK